MDNDYILKCCALTAELCVAYAFYIQYKKHADCLNSLKGASCLELDGELKKAVQSKGEIKYAAISGKVTALTSPISSYHVRNLDGVIHEKITYEHKAKWNPFLGIWGSANSEIMRSVNCIPFALSGKAINMFKKRIHVEVVEPLTAKELVLPTVYDEFTCHKDSIGDAVFGVIRGEKLLGIHEVERVLSEKEHLTAVGKLIIENNVLKIKPPDDGLTYFLTPLSFESLVNKVKFVTKFYKAATIVLGGVSLAIILYLSKHTFSELRQKMIHRRNKKKLERERLLRRRMAKSMEVQPQENIPKCIVCLDNPVEIIILECGHACLCLNCSEHIQSLCPICRNAISRTVSTFWP